MAQPGPSPRLTTVATYGRGGAGARVRVYEWLERAVPDAEVHDYLGTSVNSPGTLARRPLATLRAERTVRTLPRRPPDRLLLFRQASPFGQGGVEASLLRAAAWGVYDFDDGLPWDAGRRSNLGGLVRSSAAKCRRAVAAADRVVAGNDFLADWAAGLARDVVVVPSCVEPGSYTVKEDYALGDPPRLVWIGSPSGESYVESIAGALLRLHRRTGARLTVIGDAGRTFEGPLAAVTDRVPWAEGRAEHQLAGFDVGLGPLTDDDFSRGKSAYKLLQYGAAGLPFVASPVGTNRTVARALGGGLAIAEDEWVEQVAALLEAPAATRRRTGRQMVGTVRRDFSFAAWQDRWLAALELPVAGAGHAGGGPAGGGGGGGATDAGGVSGGPAPAPGPAG